MGDITAIVSVMNFLGLGGLGLFIYYVIKGLKERIGNLTELAKEQKVTLDAVRERALEMDKLSKEYKQALTDFQDMGKKLDERRNELVKELELAIKRKDHDLARLTKLQLEQIEVKKKSLERLPDLERTLEETVSELSRQLRIVSPSLLSLFSPPRRNRWRVEERSELITPELLQDLMSVYYLPPGLASMTSRTTAEPDSGAAETEQDGQNSELEELKDETR
jgi:hypothetical protein